MSKKWLFAGVGIVVLAAAAFLAMRLINNGPISLPGIGMINLGGGGKVTRIFTKSDLNMVKAAEVPVQSADAGGSVTAVSGNTLTVSLVSKGADPTQNDGPKLEVVITQDTKIFQDTTFANVTTPPDLSKKIQQVVTPITQDEIQKNDMATVWGQKRGDRLVAETILISRPVIIRKGSK